MVLLRLKAMCTIHYGFPRNRAPSIPAKSLVGVSCNGLGDVKVAYQTGTCRVVRDATINAGLLPSRPGREPPGTSQSETIVRAM